MRTVLVGAMMSLSTFELGGGGEGKPATFSVPGDRTRGSVPPVSLDDETGLVARLKAGDPSAYELVLRTHGGRLLAVATRILRNPDDAKDALQDGMLSAFRAIDGFSGEARLATWLHRVVVNAALMKIRSRKRVAEDPIDDLLPTFHEDGHRVDPGGPWQLDADDELERQQRRELVRRCIDRLPDSYRTVILLRDIEEMDTKDAAALLGITENAVKIRLHRARQALAALLDPHFKKGEIR